MLWDVIPCRLEESYQRVKDNTKLRNVDKYLPVEMLKHSKISYFSLSRTCDKKEQIIPVLQVTSSSYNMLKIRRTKGAAMYL
jgi:hypothetical protein